MINIYEYLLSKNNAEAAEEPDEIKNWESIEELLDDFCNDSDEKDLEQIINFLLYYREQTKFYSKLEI